MPLTTLTELAEMLAGRRPLSETLHEMLGKALELFSVEAASVLLRTADGTSVYFKDAVGPRGELAKQYRLEPDKGLYGRVMERGEMEVINDTRGDERLCHEFMNLIGYPVHNIICAPLVVQGNTVGVLEIINRLPERLPFGHEDEELARMLAFLVSLAIRDVREREENVLSVQTLKTARDALENRVSLLEVICEMERRIRFADSMREALDIIMTQTLHYVKAEGGALLFMDERQDKLVFFTAHGDKGRQLRDKAFDSSQGIAGWVFRNGQALVTNDPYGDERFNSDFDRELSFRTRNIACVPLFSGKTTVGALEVLNKKEQAAFDEEDERALRVFANQAAVLLNHLIHEQERKRDAQLTSIGRAIGYILHDIRNPLQRLHLCSGVISQAGVPPARKGELSGIIDRSLQDIESLINEVLLFARGQQEMHYAEVRSSDFFNTVHKELLDIHAEKSSMNIALNLDSSADVTFVTDELKLKRAVTNLVNNAMDALSQETGGSVLLDVRREDDTMILSVADNGPGIPESILDSVFEPFASHRKTKGTGLGLAIVKNIAESQGGTVTVTSSDQGTTFQIRLPVDPRVTSPN